MGLKAALRGGGGGIASRVRILLRHRAVSLYTPLAARGQGGGGVRGVVLSNGTVIEARSTILATGGYAFPSSSGENKYLPERFQRYPTTNGAFATGDGLTLALEAGGGGT